MDQWIPAKPSMTMARLEPDKPGLRIRVAEMIRDDRKWDETRVQEVAGDNDAACILQILIPKEPRPDRLIWPYTADGRASARSAYHRIRDRQDGEPAQTGGRADQTTAKW